MTSCITLAASYDRNWTRKDPNILTSSCAEPALCELALAKIGNLVAPIRHTEWLEGEIGASQRYRNVPIGH